MDWIEKRGFNIAMTNKNGKLLSPSKQTVKNLAYAIQYTHKFQVNPTGIHSTNRNRDISKQGWIGQTIDAKKQEVFDIIARSGYKYFDAMIKSMVDESKRNNQ